MKRWLETISNIAIIVVALVIVFSFVKHTFLASNGSQMVLSPGSQLQALPGYNWSSHERTLILALQKGCRYCENSMPFYRRLADLERQQQLRAHLVAIFPNDLLAIQSVLHEQQLQIDVIPHIAFKDFNISATPTLILSDNMGKIVKSWVGELPQDLQHEVIEEIR